MAEITQSLENLLEEYRQALHAATHDKMALKPAPGKWSKKEILGHLVDSAQNNIRRFITAQYEDTPFIVYNPDKWVAASRYQDWPTGELIDLWYLLNKQIARTWKNIPEDGWQLNCRTQDLHSLEWLAED